MINPLESLVSPPSYGHEFSLWNHRLKLFSSLLPSRVAGPGLCYGNPPLGEPGAQGAWEVREAASACGWEAGR